MEAPVRLNLTVEQLLDAIRSLLKQAQPVIQRAIEEGLDKDDVRRRAREASELIRAANRSFSENEVLADATRAVAEVRAEWHLCGSTP